MSATRYFLALLFVIIYCATAFPEEGDAVFGSYNEFRQARLDDPQKKEWQKYDKVVEYLLLKNGNKVADIGAGTGAFTVLFAEKAGKNGKVYAVDIDKEMIELTKERAKQKRLDNIEYILCPPDDPLLPTGSLDLIFICDTYVFLENRSKYLQLLKNSLKENGRVAIINFHMMSKPELPPPPSKRLSKEKVTEELLNAGYKLEAENFFLPVQYFLVFSR